LVGDPSFGGGRLVEQPAETVTLGRQFLFDLGAGAEDVLGGIEGVGLFAGTVVAAKILEVAGHQPYYFVPPLVVSVQNTACEPRNPHQAVKVSSIGVIFFKHIASPRSADGGGLYCSRFDEVKETDGGGPAWLSVSGARSGIRRSAI